jgi:hypothetical protein
MHQLPVVSDILGVANAATRTTRQRENDEFLFQVSHLAIVELFSDYKRRLEMCQ